MEQNNMTSVRELLDQLSTEQLREMLNNELHRQPINDDSIRLLLKTLREKEKDAQVEITPGMQQAWEKYQQDTAKIWEGARRTKRLRNWLIRGAAAAAVLVVILIPIIPQEAGAESLWDRLTRWTADIVEFFSPDDNKDRLSTYEFKTDNPGLQQVYDAVVEMGVTEPVVPMWLPDEYELIRLEKNETPVKKHLHSCFSNGNNEIIFSVDVYDKIVSHMYHGDGTKVQYHIVEETTFNIMRNNNSWVVVWTINNNENSIFADCQEDILIKILDSIYKVEEF